MPCADLSLAAGESLSATATTAEHWLLVEMPGSWPRDVAAGGGLSDAAREAVAGWLAVTPRSRTLFVRRPGRTPGAPVAFVVHAAEAATSVRRIALDHPGDLEDVDLERDGERTDRQLVLVCGHGSRDACCARRGVAVYRALSGRLGDQVELWMSSHQGGHRFAANVLVLPAGLQFGRIEQQNAATVVSDALSGRIELSCYRGRTCYPQTVQAAEGVLRGALGLEQVGDLELAAMEVDMVRLRSNGSEYEVAVQEVMGPFVPASCGAEPEPQKGFSARIV